VKIVKISVKAAALYTYLYLIDHVRCTRNIEVRLFWSEVLRTMSINNGTKGKYMVVHDFTLKVIFKILIFNHNSKNNIYSYLNLSKKCLNSSNYDCAPASIRI
jgi:hypothetical protein